VDFAPAWKANPSIHVGKATLNITLGCALVVYGKPKKCLLPPQLAAYLDSLVDQGYSIFVVRGKLPAPQLPPEAGEAAGGAGRWLTPEEVGGRLLSSIAACGSVRIMCVHHMCKYAVADFRTAL
jgi:hypothetical protein